ncbi:sensor histidine kinase [Roseivirga misakiensis]|nr:sensor histidine kinase [Roseivirga misakiensis]
MKRPCIVLLAILCVSNFCLGQDNEEWMRQVEQSDKLRGESKFDSALFLMEDLFMSAKEVGDYEYMSRAKIEISSTYLSTKRDSFALLAINEAILYAEKGGVEHLKMTAIYNLGLVMERKSQFDSAMLYYSQAEKFYRKNLDTLKLGIVLSGMASVQTEKQRWSNAIELNQESAKLYSAIGKYDVLAKRYFVIGENYLIWDYYDSLDISNRYLDSAEIYYNKSFKWADSLSFPTPAFRSLRGLAVINERRADYETALGFMYRSNDITQRLYSRNIEDKLLAVREQYYTANLEIKALREERQKNTILIIGVAIIIVISIWLYIVDQRRKSVLAIAEKNDQINKQKIDELLQEQEIASLQGVLEGQETERKRVAIDLHDRLGGILSMVKLHFSAVEEKIEKENPNKEKFLTASELLDLAAGEVRNISHDMMSGVLAKFGLIPALEDLKTRISETGKLDLNLYVNIKDNLLSGEQELQLYRIVQELISNILKHSQATETNIQLNQNEGSVNLIVEDDGVGFDPKRLENADGIGLSNLKARVAKLEGTFHVDSGKGAGTTISIDIPVEND